MRLPTTRTPAEAGAALRELLDAAVREPTDARHKRAHVHTFGEACDAWLAYVAGEKDRRPSTVKDYRNTVHRYLVEEFGNDTLLHTIDTERIDAYRERILAEGRLSRRTVPKILVLLHGILKRAKRKGWVATNAAEDAERVTVRRSGDFNVLSTRGGARCRSSRRLRALRRDLRDGRVHRAEDGRAASAALVRPRLRQATRPRPTQLHRQLVWRAEVAASTQRADERPGRPWA
jgi:hypothetical protein